MLLGYKDQGQDFGSVVRGFSLLNETPRHTSTLNRLPRLTPPRCSVIHVLLLVIISFVAGKVTAFDGEDTPLWRGRDLATMLLKEGNQNRRATTGTTPDCITEFDPNMDYFPHKAVVEVAELFSIEYYGFYKVVRNLEDNHTYVLVMCGADEPTPDQLASHGLDSTDVAFTVEVPLTQVALQYSTMEAFFEVLGARRTVQAILGTSFSTASCMQDLVDEGLIIELNDTEASLSAEYVNQQGQTNTLAQNFSVGTLVGFVGRTPFNPKSYPFPYIRTSDTLEPSREGLFETIKFYSAFLNEEERANSVWDQLQERLDCVRANAAAVELEQGQKTKMLWASYNGFCRAWDVARTGSFYYNEFADICSAELLSEEMGGNFTPPVEACITPERMYMSYEAFLEFGKDADVWMWSSTVAPALDDPAVFTDEIKAFKSFVRGELYYPGGSVGWFDQAYIQPDVLIEDFCSLAGTLDLEDGSSYQRKWFKNVFTNDVNTPNPTCDELGGIDTPRDTAGSDCTLLLPETTISPTTNPPPSTGDPLPFTDAPTSSSFVHPLMNLLTAVMTAISFMSWW